MRKIYRLSLLLCFAAGYHTAWAQEMPRRMQRIESLKVAYLSQRLELTPEEAKQFWPVYNQYERELQQIREQKRQSQLNKNELSSANDAQVSRSLNAELSSEQQLLDLRKRYKERFSEVLSPRKTALLYQAEKDFTGQLIKQLKERKQNGRP